MMIRGGAPNFLVPITMFGWIPVVLGLFRLLPPQRAAAVSFALAWMFLPVYAYPLPGIPNYTKMSATCAGVLLSAFIFDKERLLAFRVRWIDAPMILWFMSTLPASLTNGLGLYDGVAGSFDQFVTWGMPYLVGRIYFTDLEGLKELALAILLGGVAYIPFCLYEIRFSPQLHKIFYGYYQHDFAQTIREGGFRPMVFMSHGLMVGMWMASATLVATWLWLTKTLKKIAGIPLLYLVLVLWPVMVLIKSMGALGLLVMGLGILFVSSKLKTSIPIVILIVLPVSYMTFRSTGHWTGETLIRQAAKINEDRASSLEFRIENEDILAEKALQRPVFGWGGWGRARVYNEEGEDITVTDGLWVIILGEKGAFGLSALTVTILMPLVIFRLRYPVAEWARPPAAPGAPLAVLLGLYMIDCLLNAMVNPVFMLFAGGLSGLAKEERPATEESPAIGPVEAPGVPGPLQLKTRFF